MLGYGFMGKAHSNAFKKIAYITWPPPLMPHLVGIAGRNTEAVEEAARRYGYDYATGDWRDLVADERIGLFDNGGPNSLHAEPTIAAAQAGKHVICEKPLGRDATRATRSGRRWRRRASSTSARSTTASYPRSGSPRDDRGGRARRDPPLPRPLPAGLGRRSLARHVAVPDGRRGLGCARRHRDPRDRPGPVPERRDRLRLRLREDVRRGADGRRRARGGGRVRERLGRHDRGHAARARTPQRVPVGDQRLEGLTPRSTWSD